jgi:beta-galactosidase
MLMEQAPSAVSQWDFNLMKAPGRMRFGSLQAVAHGSDAVMFFQWRAARGGQEKFHSAMLPHGGTQSRTWREVCALGSELRLIDEVAGSRTHAEVAVVWDWENWWAVEGCAHPANDFRYDEVVARYYRAAWRYKAAIDVVSLEDDLSRYKVLIIPNQYAMSAEQGAAVHEFVHRGGHLLTSFFTGTVDHDDRVHGDGYAGVLNATLGAHVTDVSPMAAGTAVTVTAGSGHDLLPAGAATASYWQDILTPRTADVAATYADGPLQGEAAILDHRLGRGRAVHVGTRLDDEALEALVAGLLRTAGVEPLLEVPSAVEVTERVTDTHRYLFLLNHGDDEESVALDGGGTDLLTERRYGSGESLQIAPAGVAILRQTRAAGSGGPA